MTSKEQRKLQKRKAREKSNRQQVLVRRELLRAPAREAREEMRREKRLKKLQRDLEHFDQVMGDRELLEASDDTLSQLEKNILILKALEEEYNREVEQKAKINQQLENEGYYTLEEKMEAARRMFDNQSDMGVGGSADCKVSVNRPIKDVAEVSVIKAPQSESTENS
jgi:hypothetical protein